MVTYHICADMAAPDETQSSIVARNMLHSPCDWILTVHGPTASPFSVTMGDNVVKITPPEQYLNHITGGSGGVPAGKKLVVNSREKTIILYDEDDQHADGTAAAPTGVSWFAYGERGNGQGSGEYCFEKIQPGDVQVTPSAAFRFELELVEERSEPSWMVHSR